MLINGIPMDTALFLQKLAHTRVLEALSLQKLAHVKTYTHKRQCVFS